MFRNKLCFIFSYPTLACIFTYVDDYYLVAAQAFPDHDFSRMTGGEIPWNYRQNQRQNQPQADR